MVLSCYKLFSLSVSCREALLFQTKQYRVSVMELFIIKQKPKWNMHWGKWRHAGIHCVNESQSRGAETYYVSVWLHSIPTSIAEIVS